MNSQNPLLIFRQSEEENEYHQKYLKIAFINGLTTKSIDLNTFGLKSINDLLDKYKDDIHLNNIPLIIFDKLYYSRPLKNLDGHTALYLGACTYKALLKQILIENNLLNPKIKKDNLILEIIEEAKKINNFIDCDVIQDAISKLQEAKTDQDKVAMLDYLKSSLEYRRKFSSNINKLIDDFKYLLY